MTRSSLPTWPPALFTAPLLRGLDGGARRTLMAAGRLRALAAGAVLFDAGELADSVFVLESGELELWQSAGATQPAALTRVARPGETVGEEAALPGARRRARAVARGPLRCAELPVALLRRAFGRSGDDLREVPELRRLQRRATRALLSTLSLTRRLDAADLELVLDAVEPREVARGDRIYTRGDRPDGLWLVAHGLVQLQRERAFSDGVEVLAYLRDGDFFGDTDLLAPARELHAVALGDGQLLRLPLDACRSLGDRNPGLFASLRRVAGQRSAEQAATVAAAPTDTRHAFADLYRMQMARSLLTIDQDACVRCGHCAWSCEQVHGVARLVRRGDKIVTRLAIVDQPDQPDPSPQPEAPARDLLLPNSCQQCKNPLCMVDCPTGAIGRDVGGEVFIREELCTGCGNCAKACPWENIRMAPRPAQSAQAFDPSLLAAAERSGRAPRELFAQVATKCDLCRDYEAPACVQACPTEAILRLEPEREFREVAELLGLPAPVSQRGSPPAKRRPPTLGLRRLATRIATGIAPGRAPQLARTIALASSFALAVAGALLHSRGLWRASAGPGRVAGIVAALAMVALLSHTLPKRVLRLWMKPRDRAASRRAALEGPTPAKGPTRSRVRPFFLAHLGLGLLLPAAVLAHAGTAIPANAAGALAALAWASIALGSFGAFAYAWIPARLSRLEARGDLPEDLASAREHLLDRLQRELSGKSPALKQLAATRLLPWATQPLGALQLLASGHTLRGARGLLRARVEGWLPPELRRASPQPLRRAEALAGLDDLLRTCVELRALPARRVLTALLRGWLLPHVLLSGALMVALVAHIVLVTVLAGS